MGELITIFIGQAGLQLGSECWEFFMRKYGVTPDGSADQENQDLARANLIFQQLDSGFYKPRAVLIDLEPIVIDQVKKGKLKDLFDHNSYISGKECSSDNFYRAYYTLGPQIIDKIMDRIRKLIINCTSFQGFLIFHSISGGTGSAIACKLSEYLKNDYNKKMIMSYTIYPSENMSNCIMEYYNAITAVSLMECMDISIIFNNEALYNICDQHLDIESVQYSHINQMIANMVAANLEQKLNNDSTFYLDSLVNNLVPFPRLKFMLQSYSAFIPPENSDHSTVAQMTNNVFKKNYFLSNCDPRLGQFISCALLYQGDSDMLSIFNAVNNLQYQPNIQFTNEDQAKLKINFHNQTVKVPLNCQFKSNKRSLSMIANSTTFSHSIQNLAAKFDSLYAKRAFVHWYVGEGMEEFQLSHSREFLADLTNDYREISQIGDSSDE